MRRRVIYIHWTRLDGFICEFRSTSVFHLGESLKDWVEGSQKAILIGSPKDIDGPLTQVLGKQEINQGFRSLKEH